MKPFWSCLALAVGFVALVPIAEAHGPCPTCLRPHRASANEEVSLDYPTVKAVLNPTRRQLTPGPKPNCYGCRLELWRERVAGQPAITLGAWQERRSEATVRIPDIPAGRYLVALFDGSEGGTHYTWTYIEVESGTEDAGRHAAVILSSATLILLMGGAGWLFLRRRRTRRT